MSESQSQSVSRAERFSSDYHSPLQCAVAWLILLTIWCSIALDMGESLGAFLCALGGYIALVLFAILRRPRNPTKVDLFLVGWALPIIFFAGLSLFPVFSR